MKPRKMNILVVDDEKNIRRLLEKELASPRRRIQSVGTAAQALAALSQAPWDIIILDIMLPDANGLELMARFQERILAVQIILITGYGTVDDAVEAMKMGACDYITKPFDLNQIEQVVERAYQKGCAHREKIVQDHPPQSGIPKNQGIIGYSSDMDRVRFLISKVAPTGVPVLIVGESGSGKNVVAKQIHNQSLRNELPLVTKNCATFQEELMRSELFGYCKGAFTGAEQSRKGLLEMAHGGTLFLDEIGELSPSIQASLLRVMENQTFRPVGDKSERNVDIRFIFATNRNLARRVKEKRFNEALFHRLNVFTIHIPPLRNRKEDIPILVESFLNRRESGSCKISQRVMDYLMGYHWPGNVRELINVLERGAILAENGIITEAGLPQELIQEGTPGGSPFPSLKEWEKAYILKVLKHVGGNRSQAANILGINRKTLYRKMASDLDYFHWAPWEKEAPKIQ